MPKIDEIYMAEALKEARKALEKDEVPVGAVIVYDGKIIARGHNQIKMLRDPTAHAEMIAITGAATHLNNERLLDATVYTTIEPCPMCAGALVLARIKRLVFGARDPKGGAFGSAMDMNKKTFNHKIPVTKDVLKEECGRVLSDFFRKKRQGGKAMKTLAFVLASALLFTQAAFAEVAAVQPELNTNFYYQTPLNATKGAIDNDFESDIPQEFAGSLSLPQPNSDGLWENIESARTTEQCL